MKRDFSIVPPEIKGRITHWLNLENALKGGLCPFSEMTNKCDICNAIFPKLNKILQEAVTPCPCTKYSLKYVIKMAKEVIK